jgi:hypothetical protein
MQPDDTQNVVIPVYTPPTQPEGADVANTSPIAPESPVDAPTPVSVEDQNGGVNTAESGITEPVKEAENEVSAGIVSVQSAPTPLTPQAPQLQPSAQFDQAGFVHGLLIKAQAKIQFNKQKKLDKIIVLAQKKKIITNDDVQKLLYVSDATATRYLVKLVQQGRLARAGNPRDAKYQFVR